MGKTSRKTKAKKSDFNKVKLKVGKRKPLAANATVTSFKSQSIYISEQLKNSSENKTSSSKNQNISDLLSHLNHFSPAFRNRALNSIKEILLNQNDDKRLDPASIVEKVSKCMIDDDADVRNACISTLRLIFAEMPEQKISPFFPLLLAHLYCAMSHLATDVQRDSLKIVDLFLEHYPHLVSHHGNTKLLQYFVELISMKESGVSNRGRVLDMKLSIKKESAVEWRLRVLSGVNSLLKVSSLPNATVHKTASKVCQWDSENIGNILFPGISTHQGLLLRHFQKSNIVSSSEPSSEDLVSAIIPILLQCWVEVSGGGILSKDAETTSTMIHVLSITVSLCLQLCMSTDDKVTTLKWLRKMYMPSFIKHFFNNFPIQRTTVHNKKQGVESKKRKKHPETEKAEDIRRVNLLICQLFAFLASNDMVEEKDPFISVATEYLSEFLTTLSSSTTLNDECFVLVMDCVRKLTPLRICRDHQDDLISSLYQFCCHSKCIRSHRVQILDFMMEFYEESKSSSVNSSLERFLSSLSPQFLSILTEIAKRKKECCKMDPDLKDSLSENLKSIMRCMQCATRRNNQHYLRSMSDQLSKLINLFIEKYTDLFCTHLQCSNCTTFQVSVFGCVIPQLKSLSPESYMALSGLCNTQHISSESVTFLTDLLVQRVEPNEQSQDSLAPSDRECILVLKFLLSVLLSTNQESHCKAAEMEKHIQICDHIIRILNIFCLSAPDLWRVLNAFLIKKIMTHSESDDDKTLMGILKLCRLLCTKEPASIDYSHVGSFLSKLLIKSCEESGGRIDDHVNKYVIKLLKLPSVMEPCLKSLTEEESPENILALTKLLRIGELQENCIQHSSLITAYVEASKIPSNADSIRKLNVLTSLMLSNYQ